MDRRDGLTRRQLLASAPIVALSGCLPGVARAEQGGAARRLTQSVCRWCHASIPLRDFCQAVAKMGLAAIDLLTPDEWPVAREFGLTCSMGSGLGGPIERGLNDPANHDPAIVRAIADTVFSGFVAHEFVPKRDPLTSLREAMVLCAI